LAPIPYLYCKEKLKEKHVSPHPTPHLMKFYLKKSVEESHLIMGKLYDKQFAEERQ